MFMVLTDALLTCMLNQNFVFNLPDTKMKNVLRSIFTGMRQMWITSAKRNSEELVYPERLWLAPSPDLRGDVFEGGARGNGWHEARSTDADVEYVRLDIALQMCEDRTLAALGSVSRRKADRIAA